MEFKQPRPPKRSCDSDEFSSPCNRKKTKRLSYTFATPETCKNKADPFDDNFSQFFRSQFIKQIDLETSIIQNGQNLNKSLTTNGHNFTQCDGLSQLLWDSQFESSITSGQRCAANESSSSEAKNEENATDGNDNDWRFVSQTVIDRNDAEPTNNRDDCEEEEQEAELTVQSSQLFLKELTTLQLNISSIIEETSNANKFHTQDFIDPANGQFEVYKSSVTESQYMHLKRSNEHIGKEATQNEAFVPAPTTNELNDFSTEAIEDQLLAEMQLVTQSLARSTEMLEDQYLAEFNDNEALDVSERLNECIDPDSSALAVLSDDDDDKEAVQKLTETKPQVKEEQTPKNTGHRSIAAIQQSETTHHSPVTASNFYSMGPFFGLPLKVKKLIKTFKNIDDLYGKSLSLTF